MFLGGVLQFSLAASAENCVTQSQMDPAERTALASTAQTLASNIQANNQDGVKSATIPEFASNFAGIGSAVSSVSPNLTGDKPEVEQVYVLDASDNKKNPDGSNPDADFICTLNKGSSEADFTISSLPPGRYGFAMVDFSGKSPYLISMLLRQDGSGSPWKLAGFFPKSTTAAGHDGLWYWKQGRDAVGKKQPWVAFIDFQEARLLLQPAGFVSSTHLENLRVEASSARLPRSPTALAPTPHSPSKEPTAQNTNSPPSDPTTASIKKSSTSSRTSSATPPSPIPSPRASAISTPWLPSSPSTPTSATPSTACGSSLTCPAKRPSPPKPPWTRFTNPPSRSPGPASIFIP